MFTKLLDTAIFSMTAEGDPYLTTYLNEELRTNTPEHQNNTFFFPTPKSSGKTEYRVPMQTRILKELHKLKEKNWTQRW